MADDEQLAIVFADVVGSTHLYEAMGDERARETVQRCLDVMKEATEQFGGKVIKTMGGQGCEYRGKIYPVDKVDVLDVSGAGDTFIAALAHKYTRIVDIEKAINFANYCASQVVQMRGTTTL